MTAKKRVLLKLTGEIFISPETNKLDAGALAVVAQQIKQLSNHQFGIVIGGGNFFRGSQHGASLGMTPAAGHQVGMLATLMNGVIIKDIFEQHGLHISMFSAIDCPQVGLPLSTQAIHHALESNHIVIFAGGTGNPFFSTDTNAVIRGLQMNASEVWKGTKVDGIYDADPNKNPDAKLIKELTHRDIIAKRLGIMDVTAFVLAEQHNQPIRVFNIFANNALIHAAQDTHYGSLITTR